MPGLVRSLRKPLEGVEGYLEDSDANSLYQFARRKGHLADIVEIGAWKGKSAICLAQGLRDTGSKFKVYSIDPFTGITDYKIEEKNITETFSEFMANITLAGVKNYVIPIKDYSYNVATRFERPISVLFIDGWHTYEAAKKDFDDWMPKVVQGGIVALHDTRCFTGPKLVAREMIRSGNFRRPWFTKNMTYSEKERNGLTWGLIARSLVWEGVHWKASNRILWWRG